MATAAILIVLTEERHHRQLAERDLHGLEGGGRSA
jgi:hypothetical protein